MNKRYNVQSCSLDLSNFAKDHGEFIILHISSLIYVVSWSTPFITSSLSLLFLCLCQRSGSAVLSGIFEQIFFCYRYCCFLIYYFAPLWYIADMTQVHLSVLLYLQPVADCVLKIIAEHIPEVSSDCVTLSAVVVS